jgi:hypothetical protein
MLLIPVFLDKPIATTILTVLFLKTTPMKWRRFGTEGYGNHEY